MFIKDKKNYFVLALAMITNDLYATNLTLNEAIQNALNNHSEIEQAKHNSAISKNKLQEAKSSYKPSIDLEAYYMTHPIDSVSSVNGKKLKKQYSTETTITLSQPIYTFGKISNNVDAANYGLDAAKYFLGKTKLSIKSATKKKYYGVLLAKNINNIYKESVLNAKRNKSIFEKRFSNGRPPQSDIIQLSRDIAARNPNLASSHANYQNSLEDLQSHIGTTGTVELTDSLRTNHSLPDYSLLESKLLNNSFDLKLAKTDAAAKNILYKANQASYYPNIGAFASMTYTGEDQKKDFSNSGVYNVGTIGISLTAPIWDSGKRSSIKQASYLNKEISYKKQLETKRLLTLNLKVLNTNFYSLKEEIKNNRRFLKLAEDTYKMSQKRFRSGQTSIIEINDTEQLLTQAKLQLINNIYKLNITKVNIEELINGETNE